MRFHACSGQAAKRPDVFQRVSTQLLVSLSALLCLTNASTAEPPATTGAKIDETRVAKIYYVDSAGADAADDDRHGTQDSPFLTIKHAVAAALHDKDVNVGAKIIIGAGIYRESIELPAPGAEGGDTDAPLVIEASERGQTIIDAADADGWGLDSWKAEGPAWVHPWPFKPTPAPMSLHGRTRGSTESGTAPLFHPELLFFNGAGLREVESPAALVPGSFCVVRGTDHKNPVATVRVVPPETDELTGNAFAIGLRETALLAVARRNLVVRGLLFQHTANPSGHPENTPVGGMVFRRCANVLVEDVVSQWHNETGLVIEGSATAPWSAGFTLRRVKLINNGTFGLDVLRLKNVVAEDCETSFNSFHNAWAGTVDPEGPAGTRAQAIHGSSWRRHRAVGNTARGMCWASDCTDLLLEDAVIRDNLFSGLLIENSTGPSVVRGCFVSGNKTPPGTKPEASQPAAVSVEASPDVTLENNVIAGNLMPQLGLRDVAERTDGVNFETGAKTTLRAERHVYRHNAFWGANAEQILWDLPISDHTGKSDFAFYYGTLDSDENCFWNSALSEAFCTYDRMTYRRAGVSLAGWRTFLLARAGGQGDRRPEMGSLWVDPLFMEPGEGDYRLQAQSPLIDWGLPSDEGAVAQ